MSSFWLQRPGLIYSTLLVARQAKLKWKLLLDSEMSPLWCHDTRIAFLSLQTQRLRPYKLSLKTAQCLQIGSENHNSYLQTQNILNGEGSPNFHLIVNGEGPLTSTLTVHGEGPLTSTLIINNVGPPNFHFIVNTEGPLTSTSQLMVLLLLLLSRFSRVRLCATHRLQPTRLLRPWDSPGKNTGVGCHFLLQCMKVKSESEVSQSCPTLSDPTDCSLPGSSDHGIFQARVLELMVRGPLTSTLIVNLGTNWKPERRLSTNSFIIMKIPMNS